MLERKNKPTILLSKIAASMGLILVSSTYVLWHHLVQLPKAHLVTLKSRPHNVRDTVQALQRLGVLKAAPSVTTLPPSPPVPQAPAAAVAHSNIEKSPSLATSTTSSQDQVALAAPLIAPSAPNSSPQFATPPPVPPPVSFSEVAKPPPTSPPTCSSDVAVPSTEETWGTPGTRTLPLFANGDYTGQCVETDWGHMQVRAIVRMNLLHDVQFVLFPEERRQSMDISAWALPILAEEAIQRQSAAIDIVSQATFTSTGFRTSLASALVQAKVNPAKK